MTLQEGWRKLRYTIRLIMQIFIFVRTISSQHLVVGRIPLT